MLSDNTVILKNLRMKIKTAPSYTLSYRVRRKHREPERTVICMNNVTIDFRKTAGGVKPMHGIGNAPLLGADDSLFHYLKEAGIPFSRLHDTDGDYGGGRFVDIPNIFRRFEADPEDPASYDFAFTDWLLAALAKQDVKPFYRLGVSIENNHKIKAYNIFPPKDALKWAKICAGIIRHYTQGWASGFYYDIAYWEIWNEPDNTPEIEDNPMWKGTPEDYFRLYEVTSNYLKAEFPGIKIGGYASCGFYALSNADFSAAAHSSSRVDYFIDFFHRFLDYIRQPEHKSPLDFFSWHSYASIPENVKYAEYVRKTLDSCGFTATESVLNEWNPGKQNRGSARDAAYIAASFCAMQKAPVDMCMYYDGQVFSSYGGLFSPLTYSAFKAYYSFKAFNELYKLRGESYSMSDNAGLFVCAASGGREKAALLSNTGSAACNVKLNISGLPEEKDTVFQVFTIDETHDLTKTGGTVFRYADALPVIEMPAESVVLLKCGGEA